MLKTISRNNFMKILCNQYVSSSSKPRSSESGNKDKLVKKRSFTDVIITLISNEKDVSVTSLAEAQRMSKKNELKLVKILDVDTKTQRPVYKLMSGADYYIEDLKRREEKRELKNNDTSIKGEKLLPITAKIGENDLRTRIKNASKWLSKRYEVRVVISGSAEDTSKMETLYTKFEKDIGDAGKFLQKRFKGSEMKFQISPIIQKHENATTMSLSEPQKREMHTRCDSREL